MEAKDSLRVTLRKMLLAQAAITVIAALVALPIKDVGFALALAYGGAVTIAGTWIHAWRLLKVATDSDDLLASSLGAEVFRGAVLKMAVIIGLLAIGMGVIKLDPLAVVIGFTAAYMTFFFARGYAPRSRPGS